MNRFLIDECLSVALAAVAKARGFPADFGPHLGLAGWQDWNIARFAFDNDYIIVTNNRRDFLREYLKFDVHAGLVILVPHVDRDRQIKLFSGALDQFALAEDWPVNMLIEVLEDETVHIRQWSHEEHDLGHIAKPGWQRR